MLYRNKVTNEVADMLTAHHRLLITMQGPLPEMSMQISVPKDSRFYWMTDLNPPTIRTVDDDEFDQWELTNPSRDIPITHGHGEQPALAMDIQFSDGRKIKILPDGSFVVFGKVISWQR